MDAIGGEDESELIAGIKPGRGLQNNIGRGRVCDTNQQTKDGDR